MSAKDYPQSCVQLYIVTSSVLYTAE